jgi:hypothetical protein
MLGFAVRLGAITVDLVEETSLGEDTCSSEKGSGSLRERPGRNGI